MTPLSDQEILFRFRQAATKEAGFTALVEKYQQRIYWQVRRLVVSHEDANDVVQNIFIRVWNGLERFREDSQLFTWLYRVATNECLSFLEQQKRKPAAHSLDQEEGLADRVKGEEHFDAQKLEWKLQLAIQRLPEKQRIVFMLRYYDEMPYEEMSKVLATSEGALKASYHHAAKKVEEYLLNH